MRQSIGRRPIGIAAGALLLLAAPALLPAGDPPPGPPWIMNWEDARSHALERGQPIFIYFTKTY